MSIHNEVQTGEKIDLSYGGLRYLFISVYVSRKLKGFSVAIFKLCPPKLLSYCNYLAFGPHIPVLKDHFLMVLRNELGGLGWNLDQLCARPVCYPLYCPSGQLLVLLLSVNV